MAYRLLRAVDGDDAYANLTLPGLIRRAGLDTRDAALATELGYGTLRCSGSLDEILGCCLDRSLQHTQPAVRDLLRLGAYQLLQTRIPQHAAVATTVALAHGTGHTRAAGLVNAVLRRISRDDWSGWIRRVTTDAAPLRRLAVHTAHPEWIAAVLAQALGEDPQGDLAGTAAALAADNERPQTHLVAWPGRIGTAELAAETGGQAGRYSPYAVTLPAGDPARVEAVRQRRAGVQDEGSQLCALALTRVALSGRDERWLDLCAGPGGKTALLAAVAGERGARVQANEPRPHRARLVRRASEPWQVEVSEHDGRELPPLPGGYDRVLVDAPCTGLGALRRRPEARWRHRAEDASELAVLQTQLLRAALRLTRPGGVVGYVTCSPHPAETTQVLAEALDGDELIDARPAFPGLGELGDGPSVQLWPHRHGTDAMFCALIRRRAQVAET